jgi:hypothetical protein
MAAHIFFTSSPLMAAHFFFNVYPFMAVRISSSPSYPFMAAHSLLSQRRIFLWRRFFHPIV